MRRAHEAGLVWPLAQALDEEALQARLYRREVPLSQRPWPEFAQIHAELARTGVTRWLLWQEYKFAQPEGWQCGRRRRSIPTITSRSAEPIIRSLSLDWRRGRGARERARGRYLPRRQTRRASERGRRLTREAHRPQRHVAIIERSLAHVLDRAAAIGPATVEVLSQQARLRACSSTQELQQMAAPDHTQMSFEDRLGLMRDKKKRGQHSTPPFSCIYTGRLAG